MAEGYSNAGIARRLYVSEGTVEKHVQRIFPKLRLSETTDDHRRVLAVLTFLDARTLGPPAASGPFDQILDGRPRERGFRQEADGGHRLHQIHQILFGIGRDHDHPCGTTVGRVGQQASEVQPALRSEVDVDEGTSGRSSSRRATASAVVDATPTTRSPSPSRTRRAASRNSSLSSTIRRRSGMGLISMTGRRRRDHAANRTIRDRSAGRENVLLAGKTSGPSGATVMQGTSRVAPDPKEKHMSHTLDRTATATAIRPFAVQFHDSELDELRTRVTAHAASRERTRSGRLTGRPVGHDPRTGALLGDRVRLPAGRGAAECRPPVRDRDRRARHPLHPREVARTRTPCR